MKFKSIECDLTYDAHAGCFCPEGLLEFGDKCVPRSECPGLLCKLPADSGPCEYEDYAHAYSHFAPQCLEI